MSRTIIVSNEVMGNGPEDLGKTIMGSFLRKLCMEENKPATIVFYTAGVKLLAEGSPVLDAIDALSKAGIDIIACGTCVNYYKLGDKIAPENIGDMPTIISILMKSDVVITV